LAAWQGAGHRGDRQADNHDHCRTPAATLALHGRVLPQRPSAGADYWHPHMGEHA